MDSAVAAFLAGHVFAETGGMIVKYNAGDADLQAAFYLAPPAEAFLDSDPFNGVQDSSCGDSLQRCRLEGDGRLPAQVAVRAGFVPQCASDRVVNLVLRRLANAWLISDIASPGNRQSGSGRGWV